MSVSRSEAPRSLVELLYPDHLAELDALEAVESGEEFDPTESFDLWVAGTEVDPTGCTSSTTATGSSPRNTA